MRADIHDGPEQMLQSKAGYIDARPLTASSAKPLATRGRTIHSGQTEKTSARADVFRFFSKLRHCSMRSALRICANRAHHHLSPATCVSQVCGCLTGWLWQPRIYSLTKI